MQSSDPVSLGLTDAVRPAAGNACDTAQGETLDEATHVDFDHACLNNAQFREFLKDRLRAIVDSGADGVHIDELPTRYFTRQEGYCDACMAGFREYLAAKYSAAELKSSYQITSIDTFDFRERLAQEGNLAMYKHDGFWQCMDTYRDYLLLTELWKSGKAPWKVW